jgi:two-component system chemotaxis response regulator CheB
MPVHLITLDINMPVMTGDTTLKHIMIRYRTPVVIISSLEPHSMQKVFDFLQLGAVDYLAKPGVHDDLTSYGENLRKLVRGVAKARVSNFRRLRKQNDAERSRVQTIKPAQQKILIIVGAEGAHMDWLRLPLQELCSHGPVIGLQKLDDGFAHRFARFIEDKTGVKTEHLSAVHEVAPGNFYLANARHEAEFKLRPEKPLIDVDVIGSTALDWENGVKLWLERLAEQAREAATIYFMSAADPLPGSLIAKLLDWKVRQILSPPESVVCSQMIDSIQPYAVGFPDLVLHSSSDTLPEVL